MAVLLRYIVVESPHKFAVFVRRAVEKAPPPQQASSMRPPGGSFLTMSSAIAALDPLYGNPRVIFAINHHVTVSVKTPAATQYTAWRISPCTA